ncbi:MAG: 50S ribosomal protein L18 [Candidatus Sungbacteria bacterium RIFCSPLOWO2_01_FULL_54_21]|uniref:Large ribosomal subunit protein uL18 n=2 Tax=Candidatus Sungiibacteriota TaxID=1817917 RepID=A0A1G2L962_9BACT|nr:MAG: 50S ribosomal protein L18 [Candidatus Sungbacteria bacterium RIFCSPHIGHO2_01_FULL_54_26]OHA02797.1 MAG: 50S ribosomal protein L18 [Candidatus Sungbacteria bacterium RIFCSPHIGHO2_02_FULL_53_17]OHA08178.1 MAG: 50S ribosomal protein L18 [Candidatus Sungbacteria bacterium RIFCSPLOWO2_01_FULL_54_21]
MKTATAKRVRSMRRHRRVRAKVRGTGERPRLAVFRSNRYLWLQLIDDAAGRTIAAASEKELGKEKKGGRIATAEKLGGLIATRAAECAVTLAVFDRGPYRYQGLVRAVAEGARKGGLKF